MNKLLSALMLVVVIISGLVGYHLFKESLYTTSELLIATSYASIVLAIYALTVRRAKIA
jgi:hypothetical protein